MSGRVERLRARLDELGAATFLVTDPVNVLYLSGFESSNAALLVGRERVLLATDGRYLDAARQVEDVEVLAVDRAVLADLGSRLGELAEEPVAFESDAVTVAGLEQLSAGGARLLPVAGAVLALRAVKEPEELEAIRRAARITTDAFERLAREPVVGRSEAEVAWWLEQALRDEGAEGLAFPVIVAAGPNAALPHHHPGRREIGPGETVIVDAGAVAGGYRADCTRTFATGPLPLPPELAEAYALTRAAQEEALAAVRPGITGRELDAIARTRIEESGLAPVLHGLGHGVGLDVHEQPVLRPTSTDALVAGNVITIEPGVYLTDKGGVRIEDLVIVGEAGPEILTGFTKDLLTLS